jgi:hypothetical protein
MTQPRDMPAPVSLGELAREFDDMAKAADNIAECVEDNAVGRLWGREAWAWREAARMVREFAALTPPTESERTDG